MTNNIAIRLIVKEKNSAACGTGAAKFSGGAAVSAQVVAGVCTQTPERQTQARELRGLYSDPGHDPPENLVAPCGTVELSKWV